MSVSPQGNHTKFVRYLQGLFITSDYFATMATARVYLTYLQVPNRCIVDRIAVNWDSVKAGNLRVGLYRDNGDTPVGGTLVVESASIVKSDTYRIQEITIADTELIAGGYWVTIESDENTTVIRNFYCGVDFTCKPRYYNRGGGYGALTAPCPAVSDNGWSPWFVVRVKNLIPAT